MNSGADWLRRQSAPVPLNPDHGSALWNDRPSW